MCKDPISKSGPFTGAGDKDFGVSFVGGHNSTQNNVQTALSSSYLAPKL